MQQNLGKEWGPQVWSTMTDSLPNQHFIHSAQCSAKRANKDRKRKATEEAKEQRRRSKYSRIDDTAIARKSYRRDDNVLEPNEVTGDIPQEYLDELKKSFYETKVVVTQQQSGIIERSTRGQAKSEQWHSERRKRLTASKVGGIAKMKSNTKRSKKVKELLYSTFRGNKATHYGMDMEKVAQKEYITEQQQKKEVGLTVDDAGLFVCPTHPWLAASPDGLVQDPHNSTHPLGLSEIKTPYTMRHKTLAEACTTSAFYLEQKHKVGKTTYRLKRRHDYYYQVQCQLHCTNLQWCDFVLRTEKELHTERIERDKPWWDGQLP